MELLFLGTFFVLTLANLCNGFQVYWNIPTELCKRNYNISFEYVAKDYGITQNKGDFFRGDEITILYNPGLFPQVKGFKYNSSASEQNLTGLTYINGGLPQDGNLTKHFLAFANNLQTTVPDEKNKGLIIIDMEHFGATWQQNFNDMEIYKILSRKRVQDRDPSLSKSAVEAQARQEYDRAAQIFIDSTVEFGKVIRPLGKWGYYQYPQCFNPVGVDFCSKATQNDNDQNVMLYRVSDALYPSLYLDKKGTVEGRGKQIIGGVREAFRVMRVAKKPSLNVPYIWYKYFNEEGEISDADLENSIGLPKKEGADGVALWGSSGDINSQAKCKHLDSYVRTSVGPIAKKYTSK